MFTIMVIVSSPYRLKKNDDVAWRTIRDETVLVPICKQQDELDSVYVLNETASSIWSLIDGARTSREIAVAIAEEYDVSLEEAEADVAALTEQLERMGAAARV